MSLSELLKRLVQRILLKCLIMRHYLNASLCTNCIKE